MPAKRIGYRSARGGTKEAYRNKAAQKDWHPNNQTEVTEENGKTIIRWTCSESLKQKYYSQFPSYFTLELPVLPSVQAGLAEKWLRLIRLHPKFITITAHTPEVEREFYELANKWRENIAEDSSITNITENINYLRIIALGEPVVPLILKELRREPAPWFLALNAITGEMTIGNEYPGDFARMAQEWVNWGVRNGFV